MVAKIKWYLTFWPHPKVTSLTVGWKFYLHYVLLVIPVDLISHMTLFEFFDPLGTPAPQSPTPGARPRQQYENPIWYVLYLSFVRTQFGIKIFENNFVIEIKWYLTFWHIPRTPGSGAKKKSSALHASFMWVTHTPYFVQRFRRRWHNRRTEAITISPLLF